MDPRMTTIATKLRNVGYHTVAIGKWHAGMSTMAHVPGARGFDRALGYLAGSEDHFTHIQPAKICNKTKLIDMYATLGPVLDAKSRHVGAPRETLHGLGVAVLF